MKRRIIAFLCLILLCLSACGKEEGQAKPTEPKEQEMTSETETEPETETHPVTAEAEVSYGSDGHPHQWQVTTLQEASCAESGLKISACYCGEKKEEVLLGPPHDFVSGGCGNRQLCKNCGAPGAISPHHFDGNRCKLCRLTVTSPVFVLNAQLDFDENRESILEKLGPPTELLQEGNLQSLVYASDLSRLTVVQTDEMGLWGVFTMDPNAFFYINSTIVRADGFAGKPDRESDTSYRDFDSCRVYGFSDNLKSRAYYGLWMRYAECDYHYLTDPEIVKDYATQSRLSYYYLNALRALNGLEPLLWSEEAAKVSRDYSQKMATENFFDHDHLYGSRLTAAGVLWKTSGENVSQGYTNAFFVCDAYYNCADHRNNILNSEFTHVGTGFCRQMAQDLPVTVLGTQTFYS